MNGYKKILKSQKLRFQLLKAMSFIPDRMMLNIQYYIKTGRKLNLKNPKRYTEKIQWYKLYYHDEIMRICADKYMVHQFLHSKGLGHICNKIYGVYENANDIDFDKLPDKFVLKTTNGSETNIFCYDKKQFDKEDACRKLNYWKNKFDFSELGREWAYKCEKPLIIAEELLESKDANFSGIDDYKFICFNGEIHYIVYDVDRFKGHKRNFYDSDWNYINVNSDCENIQAEVKKPKFLEDMKNIVRILAKDFPHVRVDLYYVNGEIRFGELTFYPWTGYVIFTPDEFDFEVGEKFVLPEKRI